MILKCSVKTARLVPFLIFPRIKKFRFPGQPLLSHSRECILIFFQFEEQSYMIYCDSYSKWIGVQALPRTTAQEVCTALLQYFAMWGLPATIVSDHGPPFESVEYTSFLSSYNVQRLHSPVYSPSGNGIGEKAVETIKNCLKKLLLDQSKAGSVKLTVSQRIAQVMFNYANTPSSVTNLSPNEMLLKFRPRTLLTILKPVSSGRVASVRPFRDGDRVLIRFNTAHPVDATIVRQLSAVKFLVDVSGVLREAHFNQLAHGPLVKGYPLLEIPTFLSRRKR